MAMENGPFFNDVPIKISIHRGLSIAMFDYHRVFQVIWQIIQLGELSLNDLFMLSAGGRGKSICWATESLHPKQSIDSDYFFGVGTASNRPAIDSVHVCYIIPSSCTIPTEIDSSLFVS